MKKYGDLIKYENENSSLEFKAIQYKRGQHEECIKDIMAIANANVDGERHIIIGVKPISDGTRELLGIQEEFIDASTYQQLIDSNVEPSLIFDYFPYEFEKKIFGIFKFSHCDDQPYMMKKDYETLDKGDCYIRKGSFKSKMTRGDFDLIYARRSQISEASIKILFSDNNLEEIEIAPVPDIDYTSDRVFKRIEHILQRRDSSGIYAAIGRIERTIESLNPASFTHKSTEELLDIQRNVKEKYKKNDEYELFELYSSKINFRLINSGGSYIEDATIIVEIPNSPSIKIAPEIYNKPRDPEENPFLVDEISELSRLTSFKRYPNVSIDGSKIIVMEKIGDIKHHLPINAFSEPIRIAIFDDLVGTDIEITIFLLGKNIQKPIQKNLKIKVITPA
jgi:hypothetical protein